jgi:secreted PhoX family phosphatase
MGISGNWDRRINRRAFLGIGGMSAAALVLGSRGAVGQSSVSGFGDLVEDPRGNLDLPRGFQYRVISAEGTRLSRPRGDEVPSDHDGMAAFRGRTRGTTVLVRNHELNTDDVAEGNFEVPGKNPYDPAAPGGTTGIVVDNDTRKVVRDYVTSSGTINNCAGGATPWGTWITCEEDRSTTPVQHGYCFEVDPRDPENDLSKTPIYDMGYFSHEAVDIDPNSGIAYLTEDDFRGDIPDDPNDEVVADDTTDPTEGGTGTRVSYLYRYIPNDRSQRPGALQEGGRLEVLTIDQGNFNMDLAEQDQKFGVRWKKVNPEEPHESAEDLGAARFNRLEGAHFAGGAFWFDDTQGGEDRLGQIYRYRPASQTLELFYESNDVNNMESPDNIVVTPWGDLWFAEDDTVLNSDSQNRIMGITPEGEVYTFANNRLLEDPSEPDVYSEFAGPTFSPDGSTFFVNIQNPGRTYAIWGPFRRYSERRRQMMATAAPPAALAPLVSGELAEAAQKYGLSTLEAAAFERLGVPLV